MRWVTGSRNGYQRPVLYRCIEISRCGGTTIISSMIARAVELRRNGEEAQRALEEENSRLQAALRESFQPQNILQGRIFHNSKPESIRSNRVAKPHDNNCLRLSDLIENR